MTVQSILDEVRYTIGDERKTKYTDARLLILYNEGMRDIVKATNIFRESTDILVETDITEYLLPNDVLALTRVTQDGRLIPFKTFSEMDNIVPYWELEVGTDRVKAIVYNEQNLNEVTIYPILNSISGTYFKLPDGTSVTLATGTEGAITYLAGTADDHTVAITREDPTYGALVDISYDWYPLNIQYTKKPELAALIDECELPDIYYPVIKYYIAGTVLLDDNSNENAQKGSLLLQKHAAEVKDMKKTSSMNFHRTSKETGYKTPFN
jgi:hypothetical protein